MAPPECGQVRGRGDPPTASAYRETPKDPRKDDDGGVIELSFGTDQSGPWIVLYPHRVAANATDTGLGIFQSMRLYEVTDCFTGPATMRCAAAKRRHGRRQRGAGLLREQSRCREQRGDQDI